LHHTLTLFGRKEDVPPGETDASAFVEWKDAFNFGEIASHLLDAEFESAVIIAVNCSKGADDTAAVRVTVERDKTNFKGFTAHFWLHDKPYAKPFLDSGGGDFDFDWVAFIPINRALTH
jgi:hypothetical protein